MASSSSYVYAAERELVGRRGCRILFPAILHPRADGRTSPKSVMQVIFDRMVVNGDGWAFVSKSGILELRTCIDMHLYSPQQPDFLGATRLDDGRLSQRRPPPLYVLGEGQHENERECLLDFGTVLTLSESEVRARKVVKHEADIRHRDEVVEARDGWHQRQDEVELAHNPDVDLKKQRARREALLRGFTTLPPNHLIHIDAMGWRTCAQIAADPVAYVGLSTSSPLEFDYPKGDGQPQRGKGKIFRDRGVLTIIDYAHGSNARYTVGSDADFEALVTTITGADHSVGSSVPMSPDPQGLVDDIQDAPLPHRAMVVPIVPANRYEVEARASLRRRGITCASGLALQRAMLVAWVNAPGRLAIGVPTYADAVLMRALVAQIRPGAIVMIMPGRVTDAVKQRDSHGVDIFDYPDEHEPGKMLGRSDSLCAKLPLVRALHGVGMKTVGGMTCVQETGMGRTECAHIGTCGYVKRQAARSRSDVLIYTISTLTGEDNPLIASPLQSLVEGTVLVDAASMPTGSQHMWNLSTWERVPELRQVLTLARDLDGEGPGRAPPGLMKGLEEWAGGLSGITPNVDVNEGRQIVAQYWDRAKSLVDKDPPPMVVLNVVRAWLDGLAHIRPSGDKLVAYVHEPLRRLAGTRALVATAVGPKLTFTSSRLGTVRMGAEPQVDAVLGTIELPGAEEARLVVGRKTSPNLPRIPVLRAGPAVLPSRVVQIAEDSLAIWLHKRERPAAPP
jgi:hypothetical protein